MTRAEQYLRPDVARRVKRLDLRARFIVEGFLSGLNDSPYHGFSPEFAEHRNYVPGDDTKWVDWTAWAKSDRLYIKTFEAETNLEAHLLVDTSRSMAFAGAPAAMTKLEYATALAAAIGYLLTRQNDAVGLGLLGSGLEQLVPARASRRQLVRLLTLLAGADGRGETSLAPGLEAVARRLKHRGLVLLMSDLLDKPEPVIQALKHLRFRGHDLLVFHILDPVEADLGIRGPVVLEDPETGQEVATDADHIRREYCGRVEAFVDRYRHEVRKMGGDFVTMTTSTPFDRALVRFLAERKRRF